MTILDFPIDVAGVGFSKFDMTLGTKSTKLLSPFTGRSQVLNYPYNLWRLKADLSQSVLNSSNTLRSFLAQLRGQGNQFRLKLPQVGKTDGSVLLPITGYAGDGGFLTYGTGTIVAGSTSINTASWAPNSWVLNDGDYFTINEELKQCVGSPNTDSFGNCTITFWPPLHKDYVIGRGAQIKYGFGRNILRYMNDLSATTDWFPFNATISTATDALGNPGVSCVINKTSSSIPLSVIQYFNTKYPQNRTFTLSAYVKAGTYSGQIVLYVSDNQQFTYGAVVATLTGSWVRISSTFTVPAYWSTNTLCFVIQDGNGGSTTMTAGQNFNISIMQLEESPNLSGFEYTTSGSGSPTVIMQMDNDDAATWSLTPPFEHSISISAIESFQ